MAGSRRLIALFALFLTGPALAWAWYHVGTPPPEVTYSVHPREHLPGYTFVPEPVTARAIDMLATTNFINGHFTRDTTRITVFAAFWSAETAKQMSVVSHTPDVCWVGTGFTALDLGQPKMVTLPVEPTPITFECRLFSPPQGGSPELTLWCTLLGGRFLEEGFRFDGDIGIDRDMGAGFYGSSRKRAVNFFLRAITERTPSNAKKQFIRFSTSLDGEDWPEVLDQLKAFAVDWLEVTVVQSE